MPLMEGIDLNDTDISDLFKMFACAVESDVFTGSTVHWIVVGDSFDEIIKRYLCL